jgi:hypothetical protein
VFAPFRRPCQYGAGLGQVELALINLGDDLRGVVEARIGVEREHSITTVPMKARDFFGKVFTGGNGRDVVEFRLQRLKAVCLDGVNVHARSEIVANLPLVG